ncbi:undecaprenyl-phosphate glucose phosphotransferase [Proteiniphilum saccharofermentans]|uniref:Undecaprenyl-phosphate glucose phosphotransferase n=1 Tax=Proteiniphilum saccharofermentans TaxID=1642647 RepID=A0A1R3SW62_9BACT|nr:exopolysaccharide biosynthesis polyprenyl glycosylphosphotransferase [Proteiniphilum saccharofermentans]SCD20523.1 undecaprenyl-phosphate glucose phosphotransferase [Proteiniphilum saccharofermentans]
MKTDHSGVRFLYLLFDLLLLNISVYMVFYNSPMYNYIDLPGRNLYILHANISELLAYIIYSNRNYFFTDSYTERVKAFSIRFLILLAILFLLAEIFLPTGYHKGFLVEYTGFFFVFKVVVFYLIYKVQLYRYKNGYAHHRVAILGVGNSDLVLGKLLNDNPSLGFKLAGYLSSKGLQSDFATLGNLDDLPSLSERYKLNMLFVTDPSYFTKENTRVLLSKCNETGMRVRYVLTKGYWSNNNRMGRTKESARYFEMFNPQEIPLDSLTLRTEKRIFDILFSAAVILFIFSWLFPIMGLLIKLNSKGPVFFKQQRTGINNKTFWCYKFRTMTVNSESDSKQAQVNDSRITSIGHFMRKTNIDELPQFINVFLGNMSVVGPRPHMLKHTEQYSELIRHYKVRHFVKPGITGWAQVNGFRGLTDELWKMEKRVEYDMEYLEKWNFIWDIKIIFMTLFGNKAYENAG